MINIPRWIVNKIEEYFARWVLVVPVASVGTGTATGTPNGWGEAITMTVSTSLTVAEADNVVALKLGTGYVVIAVLP